MPISNGNLFKVVEVATHAIYSAISSKDPATAYYIRDVQKIVVDGVYYGFNSTDINATLLFNLLESVDTSTIDLTIINDTPKVKISAAVKLSAAGAGFALSWYSIAANGLAAYTAAPANAKIELSNPARDPGDYTSAVAAAILAGNSTPAHAGWDYYDWWALAGGATIIVRDAVMGGYEYYKMLPGDNLLEVTTEGLVLRKEVIQDLIDDSIAAAVTSKLGQAGGIATLDGGGKVPATQLPSYVDDIIEAYIRTGQTDFVNTWLSLTGTGGAALTPETGKIYSIIGVPTGKEVYLNATFRWGGSAYVNIANPNLKTLNGESLVGSGNISIAQWTVVNS